MISKLALASAMFAACAALVNNLPTSLEDAQAIFEKTSLVEGQYPQLSEGQTMEKAMYSGAFSYTGE